MLGMPFSDMHHALLLMALGVGYIVCYLAKKEGKAMKTVGYLIGTFIITLSAIIILVNILFDVRCSRHVVGTPMMMPQQRMMKGQTPPAQRMPLPQQK